MPHLQLYLVAILSIEKPTTLAITPINYYDSHATSVQEKSIRALRTCVFFVRARLSENSSRSLSFLLNIEMCLRSRFSLVPGKRVYDMATYFRADSFTNFSV